MLLSILLLVFVAPAAAKQPAQQPMTVQKIKGDIYLAKGGTLIGYIHTLKAVTALKADTYLSGHNDPLTAQGLLGLAASIEERQAKLKALVTEGKSLDQIKEALGISTALAQPGRPVFRSLVEVIYQKLTGKR